VKVESPLGSGAKPSDPVTVPVSGSAALTVGVPARGAGAKVFSRLVANENNNSWTGLTGWGSVWFSPPSASKTWATNVATGASGETGAGSAAGLANDLASNDVAAAVAVVGVGVLTGAETASADACSAVWSRPTCGCDGEEPVPAAPVELDVWVPVVVVGTAVVAAACFGAMMPVAEVVGADAAVVAVRKPVTVVPVEVVVVPDPVVVPVGVVGSVAAPEPPVAEPVWEASAALPGKEPVPVLEEPLGCVEAPLPLRLVVPVGVEEPPEPASVVAPRCLLVVPADAELEPADGVAPLEPPVEPVALVSWLLSPLVCAGVPDWAVSA
jgi:hypothetical protein